MFLRADFNPRNRTTGIVARTWHERSARGHRWSELRRWKSGDLFWLGLTKDSRPVWGHVLHIRTHPILEDALDRGLFKAHYAGAIAYHTRWQLTHDSNSTCEVH